MATKQSIHQAYLDKWACIIKEQQSSGLTIADWCTQNNISRHKYNYWKHLLKEDFIQSIPQEVVPISIDELSPSPNSPLPSSMVTSPVCSDNSSFLRITIADTSIEIPISSASPELISGIIKAVRCA